MYKTVVKTNDNQKKIMNAFDFIFSGLSTETINLRDSKGKVNCSFYLVSVLGMTKASFSLICN